MNKFYIFLFLGGSVMFVNKKLNFVIIPCVVLLCILSLIAYCIAYVLVGEANCLSWIDYNKTLNTSDNITTLLPIRYDMLSSDYKKLFSKDEFESADNGNDVYNIYLKVNSLSSQVSLKNGDIATDGYKNHLNGILYANGTVYEIKYHIFLRAKHLSFEPEIVKWYITIDELA